MICLFDFDSHIYTSVYRIVSIQQMKELLYARYDELPYSERKQLAFDFIIDEAYSRMGDRLLKVYDAIEATGINLTAYELYITNCKQSLRKNLSSNYKAKRKPNKYVSAVRKRLMEDMTVIYDDEYEADDLIADRAKELNEQGKPYIICSIDKDLKQVPGYHFDYYNVKTTDDDGNESKEMRGLSFTTPEDSWRMLAFQVIAGDSGDGVQGIPGIGKVKANQYLHNAKTYPELLNRVVRAYVYNAHKFDESNWRKALELNYRLVWLGRTPK